MSNKKDKSRTGQSNSYNLCSLLTLTIHTLISLRNRLDPVKFEYVIKSKNLSILLSLNSMMEGFMCDLLRDRLEYFKRVAKTQMMRKIEFANDIGPFDLRSIERTLNSIESGGWKNLKDIFKLIYDKKIQDVVGDEIYSTINCQFILRNKISHGNRIRLEYFTDSNGNKFSELDSGYQKVFNFLQKNLKLIEFSDQNVNFSSIFNSNVIDHFVKYSLDFMYAIRDNLDESESNLYDPSILSQIENLGLRKLVDNNN